MAGKWNLRILWLGNGCKGIHEALSINRICTFDIHLAWSQWIETYCRDNFGRHMVVSSTWRNTSRSYHCPRWCVYSMKLNRHSMHASELTGYVYLFKSLSQPKLFGYLQQPQRGHPTPCLLDCIILMFHLFWCPASKHRCVQLTLRQVLIVNSNLLSSQVLYPRPCCSYHILSPVA